jgi:hypothetical protein
MLSLLIASGWPSYPPSNRLSLQESHKKGVKKLANFTESKKGGAEVIPLEFNLPSLAWTLFYGVQNLGHYFAHLRKRLRAYHTKMICREKKPISVRKLTKVPELTVSTLINRLQYMQTLRFQCVATFSNWTQDCCVVPVTFIHIW